VVVAAEEVTRADIQVEGPNVEAPVVETQARDLNVEVSSQAPSAQSLKTRNLIQSDLNLLQVWM
jgi:hypothetical protein